jgi:cytochrome b-561 domain-containing protein 2
MIDREQYQEQLLASATVVSAFSAALILVSTLRSSSLLALFAYHPVSMSIAFLVCYPWGIRLAHAARAADGSARVTLLDRHMTTQLAALGLSVVGFAAIYANKAVNGKVHFTSLHGKLGLVTMLLALGVVVSGGLGFKRYSPLPGHWHPSVKWMHRSLGVGMWAVALVTMVVVLPHPAVVAGFWARAAQLGVVGLGVLMVMALREKGGGGKGVPIVDFTLVPREQKRTSY